MKVRFLKDRDVLDHENNVEQSFKVGKVYDLPQQSADRWIRRELAELVNTRGRPSKQDGEADKVD